MKLREGNDDKTRKEKYEAVKEKPTPGCYFRTRYTVLIMSALGSLNLFALRNVLNVAIIAMVAYKPISKINSTNADADEICFLEENLSYVEKAVFMKNSTKTAGFDWSLKQQGALLSSAFYGYIISNILGAWMANHCGIRFTYAVTGLSSSILTLFIPIAAKSSFVACLVLRIIIGFLQGPSFPTGMTAIGIWSPPTERSRFIAITFSGTGMGIFVIYPFVGLIISAIGWEAAFYAVGILGIIWSILWYILIRDSPNKHPRISKQELEYLTQTVKGEVRNSKSLKVPWIKILTSLPFIGTIAAHAALNWFSGFATLWIPIYFSRVLKFDIKAVGILASLPYLTRVVVQIVTAFLADFVITKNWFQIVTIRKVITGVSFTCQISLMIMLCYVGCNRIGAVVMFIVILGISGADCSGYRATVVDIAPSFCGILYAFSNALSSILYFVAPLITGFILEANEGRMNGWRILFWSCVGFHIVGMFVYMLFATDKVQNWAKLDIKQHAKETTPEKMKLFCKDKDSLATI